MLTTELQNSNQISCLSWVSIIRLWITWIDLSFWVWLNLYIISVFLYVFCFNPNRYVFLSSLIECTFCSYFFIWNSICAFNISFSDSWRWDAECVTPSLTYKRLAWYPPCCHESCEADCQGSTGIITWQKGCSYKVRNAPHILIVKFWI